jgi:hypothetical protein
MKNEIIKIAQDLKQDFITENKARNLLLGLFGVSSRNLETTGENFMPTIQGVAFRCHCGCTVFQKLVDEPHIYKCNACEKLYSSK